MYGDIKYLIPEQPRRDSRALTLWHAFKQGFGIPEATSHRLLTDLKWHFELRHHAAHPYTEAEPPQQHPAGVNTGAETSRFNAVTSGRAVDIMFEVFGYAAAPPTPFSRWIERWVEDRRPYHETVLAPLIARRAEIPLHVPQGPSVPMGQRTPKEFNRQVQAELRGMPAGFGPQAGSGPLTSVPGLTATGPVGNLRALAPADSAARRRARLLGEEDAASQPQSS